MHKTILIFLISILINSISLAQNKKTIAVETFRFQPISVTTQNYLQAKWSRDLETIGNTFAASFTEKLRKAGYTVVTRRNIDSLLDENKLAQQGIIDDEGSTKLRTADYRVVGTIQQFEESEKSNTLLGIAGALAGKRVAQMQGDVLISVELIARDGTVLASASGKSSKTGRINDTSGLATKVDGKFFAILNSSNKGAFSEAITNASNHAVELTVKELSNQLKKLDFNNQKTTSSQLSNENIYDLNGARIIVAFPDSPVAEEVFIDNLSDSKARIILSNTFSKELFHNNSSLEMYCENLKRNSGNAKYFIFGIIDADRINNQTNRISMSMKMIDLDNFELIHSESAQGSAIDISSKAGYDKVVKETSTKIYNNSIRKLDLYNKNIAEKTNNTFSLELKGFQSLSSANRFLNLLNKNENVESCNIVDFSNETLFAEIKFKNQTTKNDVLEKDPLVNEMFSIAIKSITRNKIIGNVIVK